MQIKQGISTTDINQLLYYMVLILGIIAAIYLITSTIKISVIRYHKSKYRKDAILLKITPQKTTDILKSEQFLMFLHGMLLNTQWRVWTNGQPYVSYEIVGKYKKIEFFLWTPRRYKKSIEEQIYICYPDCIVEEVKDTMLSLNDIRKKTKEINKKQAEKGKKLKRLQIKGLELKLGLNYVFPIADKVDIVDSIMAAMTDLEWHEKLMLQILIKPLDRGWQTKGRKIIKVYEKRGIHPNSKASLFGFGDELTEIKGQVFEELGKTLSNKGTSNKKVADTTRADREEMKEASKKVFKSGFEVEIRILGSGFYGRNLIDKIRAIASAFNKVDHINRFKKVYIHNKSMWYSQIKSRVTNQALIKNVLTPGEMAGFILRMPEKGLSVKEIVRNKLIQLAPPLMDFEKRKNLIGDIVYKGQQIPFGLKPLDARRHMHIIGGIGVGKSVEFENIILEAIKAGKGAILLDPHGELTDGILLNLAEILPEKDFNKILYYDLSDSEYPVPLNFMKVDHKNKNKSRADLIDENAEEFMNIMKQIFSDSWGIRTEKVFRHTGKALMETGEGGLWNAKQLLKNKTYRDKIIPRVKNVAVRDFWDTEFTGTTKNGVFKLDSDMRNAIDSPLTKLDRFLSSERILNMVAQDECINFRELINDQKIVIFKIPKGTLKDENTKFLGNIIFSKLMMAFMARSPEEMKCETLVLADEVQNFVTTNPKAFETLLDELRKYGVQFAMAHQRVSQIEPIISAVMDNVGTIINFRVGVESSSYMKKVFDGYLSSSDLEQLENRYAYCRALIDGQKTEPFLLKTRDKYEIKDLEKAKENVKKIIELNRKTRKPKDEVEKELKKKLKEAPELTMDGGDFKVDLDDDFVKQAAKTSIVEGKANKQNDTEVTIGLPEEWQ